MKKVLMSLFTIAIVGTLITGGAIAYFNDTETVKNNVFESGTIDFTMTGEDEVPVDLTDMKPCDWETYLIELHNEGTNDGPLYLHFEVVKSYNIPPRSEPERKAENGTPIDDIENQIAIDLALCDEHGNIEYYIIPPEDDIKLGWLDCKWIPLGWFGGDYCTYKYLLLSFHLEADTGNEYQGDGVKFNINTYMTDHNSPGGPNPIVLFLENKDDSWVPIADSTFGWLKFDPSASMFNYKLKAYGLQAGINYSLIYYPEPQTTWPWPVTVIDSGAADASGNIVLTGSYDFGMDLNQVKFWLVVSSDIVGGNFTGWTPANYLFETNLVNYDDTDV
jgi:predicted ribosomally synthesized peptide with SipW-like signal peptide